MPKIINNSNYYDCCFFIVSSYGYHPSKCMLIYFPVHRKLSAFSIGCSIVDKTTGVKYNILSSIPSKSQLKFQKRS